MTTSTETEQTEQTEQIELLTTAEVAAILRVSTMTVRRWIDDGTLRGFTRGRVRRITRTDLDTFLAESTRTTTPLTTGRRK